MTDGKAQIDELYGRLPRDAYPPGWPVRVGDCVPPQGAGVELFFEPGEVREGGCPRVVHVGESGDLQARLWQHLHGNWPDSVFRKHVGSALIHRDGPPCPSWGRTAPDSSSQRECQAAIEKRVTRVVAEMSVAWILVGATRAEYKRELIRLLHNYGRSAIDPPSDGWLGKSSRNVKIRESGLWNVEHVQAESRASELPPVLQGVD